jgi:hypothetical protein
MILSWILAEGTLTGYAQPAGFIGVLVFIIRWFMVSLDKRNDVIEKMANRSDDVIDRNTKAFERQEGEFREVKHALRGAGVKIKESE